MGTFNIFDAVKQGHENFIESHEDFQSTSTLPGSPEKIQIMRKRVEKGQPVHHNQDLRYETELSSNVWGIERCLSDGKTHKSSTVGLYSV